MRREGWVIEKKRDRGFSVAFLIGAANESATLSGACEGSGRRQARSFEGRSNVVVQISSQPISVVRPVAVAGGFFVIRREADVVAFSAVDEGLWYAASIHVKLNRGGADCFACEGCGSHKQIISSDLSILADEETQFSRLNTGDSSTGWWRGDADIVAACATGDCSSALRQSHRHPERHGRCHPEIHGWVSTDTNAAGRNEVISRFCRRGAVCLCACV